MLSQRTWLDTVFTPDNVVSNRVLYAPDAERLHPHQAGGHKVRFALC